MRTLISILFCLSVSLAFGTEKVTSFAVSPKVVELLESYCFSCHDAESKKGDVRLDNLATLALKDRLDLLNRVQEQIFIKEMPPRKKKTQPSDTERQQLYDWMSAELRKHNASKFEEKLRYPSYGSIGATGNDFLGKMADTPEGNGSMLDNTIVYYGTSNSKTHVNRNYPLLVAGGSNLGIKHCGYHNFLETGKQPLCNLYVSLLQSLDVPTQSFSDSTGVLKEILA